MKSINKIYKKSYIKCEMIFSHKLFIASSRPLHLPKLAFKACMTS
jgi:hypothetical protein